MTIQELQKGQNLCSEIKELGRIIEALERHEGAQNKNSIEILTEFLNGWANISYKQEKNELAKKSIQLIINDCKGKICKMQKLFEEL
jgi:hypothetical protein